MQVRLRLCARACRSSVTVCVVVFSAPLLWAQQPNRAARQAPLSIADIARLAQPGVVLIKTLDSAGKPLGFGSGFIVPDGRVITNSHVVAGGSTVEVLDSDGRLLYVTQFAEALSSSIDLAVLPRLPRQPGIIRLSSSRPAVGDAIVVIGAPEGLTNTVSSGIVSAIRRRDSGEWLQISAPVSPGSSGGPVLNALGELIGVSTAQLRDGQNLNFAIPASDVAAMIGSPKGHYAFPPPPREQARTLADAPPHPVAPAPAAPVTATAVVARPASGVASIDDLYRGARLTRGTWFFSRSWRSIYDFRTKSADVVLMIRDTVARGDSLILASSEYFSDSENSAIRMTSTFGLNLELISEKYESYVEVSFPLPHRHLCVVSTISAGRATNQTIIAEGMDAPKRDVALGLGRPLSYVNAWMLAFVDRTPTAPVTLPVFDRQTSNGYAFVAAIGEHRRKIGREEFVVSGLSVQGTQGGPKTQVLRQAQTGRPLLLHLLGDDYLATDVEREHDHLLDRSDLRGGSCAGY